MVAVRLKVEFESAAFHQAQVDRNLILLAGPESDGGVVLFEYHGNENVRAAGYLPQILFEKLRIVLFGNRIDALRGVHIDREVEPGGHEAGLELHRNRQFAADFAVKV